MEDNGAGTKLLVVNHDEVVRIGYDEKGVIDLQAVKCRHLDKCKLPSGCLKCKEHTGYATEIDIIG